MPVTLVWFRSDLRIHDNTALYHAARRGPVIGVFLHAEQQWREHGHGDNKLDFLCRGVEALGEALAERNIPLIQRQVPRFDDAPQALMALAEELAPDVVVMDLAMPKLNGVDATARIRKACPDTQVVVLSMHATAAHVRPALRAGARGAENRG